MKTRSYSSAVTTPRRKSEKQVKSSPDEGLSREAKIVAGVVVLGVIMSVLDTTIVNVALDTLSRDLHSPLSTIQWVSTGYLLSLAMVIPLAGWLAERFGSKRVWMVSVAVFAVGSALTSVLNTLQRLGGSIGTALLAVVVSDQARAALGPGAARSGGLIQTLSPAVRTHVAAPLASFRRRVLVGARRDPGRAAGGGGLSLPNVPARRALARSSSRPAPCPEWATRPGRRSIRRKRAETHATDT
jgi:MFS family permease